MDGIEQPGHMRRLTAILGLPLTQQHSLSGWIMLLALAGIVVFAWTRILKYIVEG
jgi:hypothetical protein